MVLGARRSPLIRRFAAIISAPFVFLRIGPNVITLIGFVLSLVPAYFATTGDWLVCGITLFIVSGFDLIDGTVARTTGRQSAFGGYLDSVLDRASDFVVLFGIGMGLSTVLGWYATGACILLSFLTSYARARSFQDVAPPPQTWDQFFERPERVLYLSLALVLTDAIPRFRPETDPLPGLLLIYALLALWTLLARIHKVRRLLDQTSK